MSSKRHAKLGPSSGKRWLACPGSVKACESVLSTSNEAADEGTAGHTMFEAWATTGESPQAWVGQIVIVGTTSVIVTQELADWVCEAIEWVEDYRRRNPRAIVHSETCIDIGPAFGLPVEDDGMTCLWGTADLLIVTARELVVFDLKLGFHAVDVGWFGADGAFEPNVQLALYAIGFEFDYSAFSFDTVRIVIHQPRAGGAHELVVPMAALHAWREEQTPRVHRALLESAPRIPSDVACRWCPAAPVCPALHEQALAVARQEFEAIDTMTTEQLAWILERADMVRSFLGAAKRHALQLARIGTPIPGFKLVEGIRRRVWSDEAKAAQELEQLGFDPYCPPKLLSPAQAEKLVGKTEKKRLQKYITKPAGNVTLAPVKDRRAAVEPDFTVVAEEVEADAVESEEIEDAEVVG